MRAGLLALALLLSPAARASAEWQIKPFYGAKFGGGTTLFDPAHAAGETKRTIGISGMLIGEMVGVEGDVGRTPGFFESGKTCTVITTTCLVLDSSMTTIVGNVVIAVPHRLTEYTLRPYFVAGGGVMLSRIDALAATDTNLKALDVGGGAVGFLSDRYGLSWDIRYFHSIRGKSVGVGGPEQLSFWRINMAFVVRLRHKTR